MSLICVFKIRRIKEIAIQLLNNIAEVPSQIKSSVNMADTDVTDYDDENSALYGKYGHYGSTKVRNVFITVTTLHS